MADRAAMLDALRNADRAASNGDPEAAADARRLADALAGMSEYRGGAPSPVESHSERASGREQSRANIEGQVGAPFTFDQGATGFWDRFNLSRNVSPESRAETLRQQNPGADVRLVDTPEGQRPVFRPEGEQEFRGINPRGFDAGDLGAGAGYLANAENVAATASSIAFRGAPWLARSVRVGLAAGAGRLADEGVEKARGRNVDPLDEIFGRAAVSATIGAVAEPIGSALARGANIPRGSGIINPTEGVEAGQRAAADLGYPGLTSGQTHPFLARRENQVMQTSQVIKDYYGQQAAAPYASMRGQIDTIPQLTDSQVEGVVRAWANDIGGAVTGSPTTLSAGGRALQRGLDEFETSSRAWVGRKYDKAMTHLGENADSISFSLEDVKGVADDLMQGTPGMGPSGPVQVEGNFTPELQQVIGLVQEMGQTPQAGKKGYEAVVALRRRLFNIKSQDWNSATPQQRDDIKAATKLYGALRNSIENPTVAGEVGDATFQRLWRSAAKSNAWREDVLEAGHIRRIANTDEEGTAALIDLYARPGGERQLAMLHRILPENRFGQFRDAYQTSILAEPEKITGVLDGFRRDPGALDLLLPRARQAELRAYGQAVQNLKRFESSLIEQGNLGRQAAQMIESGRSADVAGMVQRAGGPQSPEGRRIYAGILESVLDRASKYDPVTGQMTIDPRRASDLITQYIEGGRLNGIATASDLRYLKRNRDYLARITSQSDVGGSMSGAADVKKTFNVLDLAKMPLGWIAGGSNALQARALISPRVQTFLTGSGRNFDQSKLTTGIRAAGTVLSLTARDLANSEEAMDNKAGVRMWVEDEGGTYGN